MPKKKKTRATASSLPMMSACPNYESENDPSIPKPHAEFGSLFHKAVEEKDVSILLTEEGLAKGREAGKTRAQSEAAYAWAMEYLERLETLYDVGSVVEEMRGQCSIIPGRNFYIDLLCLTKDMKKAIVLDWKSSRNLDNYQADGSEQGWLYVAAIFELSDVIEEVDMIFAAPFCEDDDEYKTSVFSYSRSDYTWLKETLSNIVDSADDTTTDPEACSYCTWCKHYKTCAETTSIIAPAIDDRFGAVLERAKKSPILMSKLRDGVPVLTKVLEDIKSSANAMYFEEGTVIPGYQPIEMKGRTTVKNPSAIIEKLAKDYLLTIDEIKDYIKIDLKGIETVIRNNEEKGQMKKAVDDFRDDCDRAGWTNTGNGAVYLKKSKQKKEIGS